MKQQGLLVKSNAGVDVQMLFHGNNVFLDATNPRTRKYVWEKVKKNYADLGIRTFWLDEAEPEFSTYEYECYRYAAGRWKRSEIFTRESIPACSTKDKKRMVRKILSTLCAVHGSEARNTVRSCGPGIFSQPTRISANRSVQVFIWDFAVFRGGRPISVDSTAV